mgnify:CR=1 FL=1
MDEVNTAELNMIDDKYRNYYEVFVYSFCDSDGDGIDASNYVQIEDGKFEIAAGDGEVQNMDMLQMPEGMPKPEDGQMPGNDRMPRRGDGEMPEGMEFPEMGEMPEGMEMPEMGEGGKGGNGGRGGMGGKSSASVNKSGETATYIIPVGMTVSGASGRDSDYSAISVGNVLRLTVNSEGYVVAAEIV